MAEAVEAMKEYEFPTWATFRDFLNSLPADDPRLAQRMEVLPHTSDHTKPVHLLPVVSWGTIEEMLHVNGEVCLETRSADKFEHRPDLFVLTLDDSPFDEEGNSFWEMNDDGSLVGNKTGKVVPGPLSTEAPKGFYTSKLRFVVTVTHQFNPDRAVDIVKMALGFPAVLDTRYMGGETNYVLHGQPTENFRPIKRGEK